MHAGPMSKNRTSQHIAALALSVVLAIGGAAAPSSAAPRPSETTLSLSHSTLRKGEMVWLKGKVKTSSGKAVKGAKVHVERRLAGGKWKRFATLRTSSKGSFSQRQLATKEYEYRAKVVASSKVKASTSKRRSVDLVNRDQGLGPRAKLLSSVLGKGIKAAKTVKVSGTERVRYREYRKGMLVEVRKSGKTRTWLVYGDILRAYKKAGGPTGKLGVPKSDPRCGLMEAGCAQRFTKGAIYDNKEVRGVAVTGKAKVAEVLAVAKSQVGTAEIRRNVSKYNRWVGAEGQAWCSSFQSWVSRAAGRGNLIPKHKRLTGLLKDIRENKALKTGSSPKVGALVFFDTFDDGVVEATHIGIVLQVKKSTIVTVEANTSNPKRPSQRGVYQKERERSRALFYAYPEY